MTELTVTSVQRDRAALAGALLVDKPAGPTSHDVVAVVRRTLRTPRAGHTGTLDPLATGLLILLVGPATRLAQFLAADEKEYIAAVRLGVSTPTYDAASLAEGVRGPASEARRPGSEVRHPSQSDVEAVLARFRGESLQTPPPFSAKKIASVPAYEKARKKEPVELKPVPVTIRELELLGTSDIGHRTSDLDTGGLLRLRVAASAGFYVRSLAHDIGEALGCGAYLESLRRTRVGQFRVQDALTLDRLETGAQAGLISMSEILGDMPLIWLTVDGARRAAHGNPLAPHQTLKGTTPVFSEARPAVPALVRLVDDSGTLVAVAEHRADGLLHPLVVLR